MAYSKGKGTLSYLYQLQNANYSTLSSMDFKVAVIDPDDAKLTKTNISALKSSGKTLFSYLSIGEAEDYRSYWINNNWSKHPPDFLLGENPDWPGNYNVKFWDPDWQAIILNRVTELAEAGYSGVYLDIIDAFQVLEVQRAYDGASGNIRQDMVDFVIKISQAAKAINPDFKIIPQNGIELLSIEGDSAQPNTNYLQAIDGVGKEDTWTDDNQPVSWTKWDLEYLHLATNAGKFVLAVDYPTNDALQDAFIQKAIKAGFLPFVGTRALDGTIDPANYIVPSLLPSQLLELVIGNTQANP